MTRRLHRAPHFLTIAVTALVIFGCGGGDDNQPSEQPPQQQPSQQQPKQQESQGQADVAKGKQLFVANCGRCHTLSDAGTDGTIGPNLDDINPDKQRVLEQIRTGSSIMPSNLVTGQDAQDVATYVSSVAGQ